MRIRVRREHWTGVTHKENNTLARAAKAPNEPTNERGPAASSRGDGGAETDKGGDRPSSRRRTAIAE